MSHLRTSPLETVLGDRVPSSRFRPIRRLGSTATIAIGGGQREVVAQRKEEEAERTKLRDQMRGVFSGKLEPRGDQYLLAEAETKKRYVPNESGKPTIEMVSSASRATITVQGEDTITFVIDPIYGRSAGGTLPLEDVSLSVQTNNMAGAKSLPLHRFDQIESLQAAGEAFRQVQQHGQIVPIEAPVPAQ